MTIAIVQLYRILGRFEKGPADDPTCRLTPEGAALDAYLCSADKPTVAFGCTYHPDGTPVRMGDSITEDQVYPYTEAAVARVIADVKRIVKRPLNEYQMAALCSFVFNLGGGNLAQSQSLLPAIEAGRWEDAADSMGEFMRAWGKLEGKWHRKAERGLLIRRYAEGCLLLGLDWAPWCNTDNIKLKEELVWQPNWVDPKGVRTGGRYFDEVLETTTQFHTIEAMARATPLPSLELVLTQPAPPLVATTKPDGKAEQPGTITPSPSSSAVSAPKVSPAPSVVVPPAPAKKPEAVDPAPPTQLPSRAPTISPPKPVIIAPQPINPNALPTNADTVKNMADSTRMVGMVLVAIGSIIQVVTLRLGIGTAIGAVFFDLTRDPVVITLAVTAIVAALGWITKRNGKKTFAKGADQMVKTLY